MHHQGRRPNRRVGTRRAKRSLVGKSRFAEVAEWFAELDRLEREPFMPDGRQQPQTPMRQFVAG